MEPITRKEMFLAAISGEDVELPEPITREEIYLNTIAKSGGGGGGVATSLANLNDTKISSPKIGQELKYNGSKWVNGEIARYNVLDYGLKGDFRPNPDPEDTEHPWLGTDNSAAFSVLLSKLPKHGNAVIYFPAGRYLFTQPIVIRDRGQNTPLGITFLGDTVSTKKYDNGFSVGSPDSTLVYNGDANTTFIKSGTDCWYFNFKGLHFSCVDGYAMGVSKAPFENTLPYRVFASSTTKDGIVGIGMSNDLNLKDCSFTGFSGAAVEAPVHSLIDNCSFCKNKIGIDAEYDTIIRNCWFNLCDKAVKAKQASGGDWSTLIMSDTWIDQCTQGIYCPANQITMWLVGNIFDMFDESAIYCEGKIMDSLIVGHVQRAGMMYADILDENRTTALAKETDGIVASQIVNSRIEIAARRRSIGKGNHSSGKCPSRLVNAGVIDGSVISNYAMDYARIYDPGMVATLTKSSILAGDKVAKYTSTEVYSAVLESGVTSGSNIKYSRDGNVVTLQGVITLEEYLAAGNNILLTTLPTGFRIPDSTWELDFIVPNNSGGTQNIGMIHLKSDGTVKLYNYASGGSKFYTRFSISYMV